MYSAAVFLQRKRLFNSEKKTLILHLFYTKYVLFYTYFTPGENKNPVFLHIFVGRDCDYMENTDSATTRLERRKGISFNFELKKSSTGYPIFLRITEDGKHLRYKTTVTLSKKSDWDTSKQKIKYTEPRRDEWQNELDQLKEKVLGIHRQLEKESVSSPSKIIEVLRGGNRSESFLKFAEAKRDEYKAAGGLSSMRKYDQVCRKFAAFATSKGRDPYSIKFKEMDYEFIADFDAYMQTLDNKQYMKYKADDDGNRDKPDQSTPGAPKLHPNYIAKILQYTNRLFNNAIKMKLVRAEDNPFNDYKIKEVKTEREELTLDEVKRIINLDLQPGTKEWHSRNFFLCAMYCAGVRVSDLLTLRWNNISEGNRLHYQMGKNHKIQDIILLPLAIEIIDLYKKEAKAPDDYIFPYMKSGKNAALCEKVKSIRDFDTLDGPSKLKYKEVISSKESMVNNGLKSIRTMAGITKPLSTHISRHTFSRLAKEVHTDNSLLQGLLAHSSISTTERYMGRFSTDAKDEALKEVFRPLDPMMMRKKELLDQLAELPIEELEAIVKEVKENGQQSL